VPYNWKFFIRNAQFRSDSVIVATMMRKRPSSASCPLPTSVISHGAVSPLLWKMLHGVWHVPPLPPAPSQPVQSCMALFLLSCKRCCMYGTFLLCLLPPPNQCNLACSFLPNHCSNDLYCSFNCSHSYFVVLFLLLVDCTLCGVFLLTPCPSCCFPSRHHCHSLLVPCFFLIIDC
jgi:hypothetical protein